MCGLTTVTFKHSVCTFWIMHNGLRKYSCRVKTSYQGGHCEIKIWIGRLGFVKAILETEIVNYIRYIISKVVKSVHNNMIVHYIE